MRRRREPEYCHFSFLQGGEGGGSPPAGHVVATAAGQSPHPLGADYP